MYETNTLPSAKITSFISDCLSDWITAPFGLSLISDNNGSGYGLVSPLSCKNTLRTFLNGKKVFPDFNILSVIFGRLELVNRLFSDLLIFLDSSGLDDCIKFAIVCGLLTCLGEGAIEQQPDYKTVKNFLGCHI